MGSRFIVPALMVIAAVLSVGFSGGQVLRCIRRKSSGDVTIAGWLSGAGVCVCLLGVVLITESSRWLALWEGLGILEYTAPAVVAWWYRSPAELNRQGS